MFRAMGSPDGRERAGDIIHFCIKDFCFERDRDWESAPCAVVSSLYFRKFMVDALGAHHAGFCTRGV